jgi:acetylornithine/succinyldiaminopimelate/putrescine aminotransferase
VDEGLMKTYARMPEVFTNGCGAVLVTEDGRQFLDFLAGIPTWWPHCATRWARSCT